ncbi:hypothetical protein C1H46_029581 [Malus baccata]|uniref:Uncharacterized protein n=1 Tax=Malus baccata TaxID=106549 RepID=A0A540LEG8_MALBA|nr:hypothetical protein C1H46_029581 [Malus baccata]
MPFVVCRYQSDINISSCNSSFFPPHRLPRRLGELHIPFPPLTSPTLSSNTHSVSKQPLRILQVHLLLIQNRLQTSGAANATLRTTRNSENPTAKQNSANTTCVAMRWAERAGLSSSLEPTLLDASRKLKRRGMRGIGSGIRGCFGDLEAKVWILMRRLTAKFEKRGFRDSERSWGGGGRRGRSPW